MKRYTINLYFGFERLWTWFYAQTMEEAESYAWDWANDFLPVPDIVTVYEL